MQQIIQKVADAKRSPLFPAFRSMVRSEAGISALGSDHPVQSCDITIPNPPGPGFEASNEVIPSVPSV